MNSKVPIIPNAEQNHENRFSDSYYSPCDTRERNKYDIHDERKSFKFLTLSVGSARPDLTRTTFNIHLALKALIDFLPFEVYGSFPRQNALNMKNRKPSYHLFVIECVTVL